MLLNQIVNVTAVPHLSPLRYPGGKTWLVPRIRQWLVALGLRRPAEFIEPFAGGGIVGLTVAAEGLAEHVTLVELDGQVAAVWKTIIGGDAAWLADKIVNFELTPESLAEELARPPRSTAERAFQTILKNRTYRAGILAPGSAPLKHGENGRGILSRWYPQTLKRRILTIASLRERLSFIEGDGIEIIRRNAHREDVAFFIDPPYTAGGKRAGRRLYSHSDLDHGELFRAVSPVAGDFLMTYDDAEEVRKLAKRFDFDTEVVAMKNSHHSRMSELLVGRDLAWLRRW